MTKFQEEMFEKYCRKIVCVDSTHKTNPYGFKLVTIVVPDEFRNGNVHACSIPHVTNITSCTVSKVFLLPGLLWIEKILLATEHFSVL